MMEKERKKKIFLATCSSVNLLARQKLERALGNYEEEIKRTEKKKERRRGMGV